MTPHWMELLFSRRRAHTIEAGWQIGKLSSMPTLSFGRWQDGQPISLGWDCQVVSWLFGNELVLQAQLGGQVARLATYQT